MTQTPLPVDDLRQKLKDLGYLRTGVDRFVLASVRQQRSSARIAADASVRVGLLAAVLLGPAAAIGIAARLPQLVTGFRDAFVVALYLALLFGLASAALTFVATLITRLAVRAGGVAVAPGRARLASTAAGVIVSGACLAYLALWWSAVNPSPAWNTPVWTTVALAAAVSISLVIGHAVALTAGAVLARESASPPASAAAGGARRAALLLRIVAFGAAAALLVATVGPAGTATPSDASPDFAVVPTAQRVVVVGIDGFDAAFYETKTRTIDLAGFGWLRPDATARVPLPPEKDPASVWTTAATGVAPARHGISELELRRVAGLEGAVARSKIATALSAATDSLKLTAPAIASGVERKEKTFWEVAGEKGLSTAVVNWWATWPATGPGIVLSDRAILRLEHTGALNAEIFPAELYNQLRPHWQKLTIEARRIASTEFGRVTPAELRSVILRSAELDATIALLASHPTLGQTDLRVAYLPGLDIAQYTIATADPTPGALALSARADALFHYYYFLDTLLNRLVTRDALLVLVTHPGRISTASPGAIGLKGRAASNAMLEGTFLDVAPTVLYALGVPASRDITGKPLTGLFSEAFRRRVPLRTVDTYGRRIPRPAARGGQPLDQEMLDRLRSLGYVR